MAGSKWIEGKKEYLENKTKNCPPQKDFKVDRKFQESTQKPS